MSHENLSDVRNHWLYGRYTTEQAITALQQVGQTHDEAVACVVHWATALDERWLDQIDALRDEAVQE